MTKDNWKRKFMMLWTGQAISIFTSSVIQMAIVWYLTDITASAAVLTLATLLGFLPQAVLGPFTGVLIDRYNRKKIMIISDVFIAGALMVLVIVGFLGEIPIWLIMVVLFARAIGTTFHAPTLQAVTPLIVPKEHLTRCAGYSQTFQSVSYLFSPAVAAVLYGVMEINMIFLFDIGGAFIAVLAVALIRIPAQRKATSSKTSNVLGEAKEGFLVLRREPGMMALLFISMLYAIIYFPIGTLYPLISMSYFGGSVGHSSIIEIGSSLGALIGAVILGRFGDRINKVGAIRKSIAGMGIGLVATGLLPPTGIKIFLILAFFMGITIPFYHGVLNSIYQIKISEEYLGRIFSLTSSLTKLAMPLGLILTGAFAEIIGVNRWFFISGVLTLIIAMVAYMMPSLRKI
ncbi:MAG: MFS transporter [Clostridiales bacterium]|nr:MFS transporter [Clostridiales bacterium]